MWPMRAKPMQRDEASQALRVPSRRYPVLKPEYDLRPRPSGAARRPRIQIICPLPPANKAPANRLCSATSGRSWALAQRRGSGRAPSPAPRDRPRADGATASSAEALRPSAGQGGRRAEQGVEGLGDDLAVPARPVSCQACRYTRASRALSVEHLLEVGDQPVPVGRIPGEASAQMVVDAAGGHGVERRGDHARASVSRPRGGAGELEQGRAGGTWGPAETAPLGVVCGLARKAMTDRPGSRRMAAPAEPATGSRCFSRATLAARPRPGAWPPARQVGPLGPPASADRYDPPECRQAVAVGGG